MTMKQVQVGGDDDDDSQVSRLSHHDGDDDGADDATTSAEKGAKGHDYPTWCGVKRSRILIVVFILMVGGIAGGLTYRFASQNQHEDFETHANSNAFVIEEAIVHKAKMILSDMETMAVTVSTYAKLTVNTEWPFKTFPHFESVAAQFMNVTGSRIIALAPVVASGLRTQWQNYSVAHQEWLQQSYEEAGWDGIDPFSIPESVYDIDENGLAVQTPMGETVLPLWQRAPAPKDTGIINLNLLSNPAVAETVGAAYENSNGALAQLSMVTDVSQALGGRGVTNPESLLIQPVVEIKDDDASQKNAVASLVAAFSWDYFMSNLYHEEHGEGMIIVVHNSCGGDPFTYQLNGRIAVFVGNEDLHDATYDDIVHMVTLPTKSVSGQCEYTVSIYPSITFEESTTSSAPIIFTVVIVLMFTLLAGMFLIYDIRATRRQRQAQEEVSRSNALVSSLFPAQIRDRLLQEDAVNTSSGKPTSRENRGGGAQAQKFRLKTFLDKEEEQLDGKRTEAAIIPQSKPIADLFPHTTVLFADISGFTAWSSVREPSQVFTLLETVYKAFDKIAKRRKVFKVETVGDCYVAVTGLPEPTIDHAIIMCKFARDILTQFNQLSSQLEIILGPDTGDLAIRVGIHSGPVTAGVLRGDKSRFQLFGDTVNTAARIESSGIRNRIHLSHETAEQLHLTGKSSWIKRRNDTVLAKGKGELQTYWLITDEEIASGAFADTATKMSAPLPLVNAMASRVAKMTADMNDPESQLPPRIKRLVDWNVDVLKRLLKQIVARRNAVEKIKYDVNHPVMMKLEVNIGLDTYVLDEVTEIVRLPGYQTIKNMENPNEVELPEGTENQLLLYVSSIAALHRDNAFHNFEHASHVMMSVSKLLSRIVAPDEILHSDGGNDDQGMQNDRTLASSLHDHTYGITSDPLTQFSVVLAALVHDCDHSGVSNAQLIQEDAKIATVFKNKSVAEQNSIVLAWDRLMESRFSALRGCIYSDPEEMKRFRQLMVNTVLATDIFDKELSALRKNRWETAFQSSTDPQQRRNTTTTTATTSTDSAADNDDDINRKATIVIEHLIQASDVAHTMQHWHIYQKWNERLFAEMTFAYRNGRMDKNPADGWYQGELWFFDNYVIPLAKKLKECGVFGVSSDEYLNYALENRREWANKGEAAVSRMVEKYATAAVVVVGGGVESQPNDNGGGNGKSDAEFLTTTTTTTTTTTES